MINLNLRPLNNVIEKHLKASSAGITTNTSTNTKKVYSMHWNVKTKTVRLDSKRHSCDADARMMHAKARVLSFQKRYTYNTAL